MQFRVAAELHGKSRFQVEPISSSRAFGYMLYRLHRARPTRRTPAHTYTYTAKDCPRQACNDDIRYGTLISTVRVLGRVCWNSRNTSRASPGAQVMGQTS